MTAHILVVEDDESIARMIEATLTIGGYSSRICADGQSAVEEINSGQYDLMLLDIMLPKMNGFEVFESKTDMTTPVIFLTAMDDVPNKVRGLRMGAEDYIVKPFEAVELLARIEVALRRTQQKSSILSYQDILIETDKHEVTLDGTPVILTPKEFDLLVFFVKNIDIALTREQLLTQVWDYSYTGETRTVDTHVQQLRKKLNLHGSLVTISRLGYRLESQKVL